MDAKPETDTSTTKSRPRNAAQRMLLGLRESLLPFRWLILLTIGLSTAFGVTAIFGLTAFVPVISILAGNDVNDLKQVPYIGDFVLSYSQDRDTIFYTMLGCIVGLSLVKAGLQLGTQMIEIYCKSKIEAFWQQRIIGSWLNADYRHHGEENAGRIMHLSSREILQMGEAARAFVQIVSGSVQAGITMLFLALVAPVALIGVCATVLFILFPLTYVVRRAHRTSQEDALQTGNYIGRTQDVIKRIELIDILGTAQKETKEILEFFKLYLKSYFNFHLSNALSPFVIQIFISILISGLFIYFFQFGAGQGTLATVVLFVGGMVYVHPQMDRVAQAVNMLVRMGAAYDTIRPVVDLPSRRMPQQDAAQEPDFSRTAVSLENVTFSYPSDKTATPIIDGVSAELTAGGLYMLFGPTGAGKTTLLRLLQGLLTPTDGTIRYGGVDCAEMPQSMIARSVLMMPQDRPTFTGTVRENIAYGLEELSEDALDDAIRLASVDEFIDRLSDGINTHIGNDGALLSGGQRQRVALARVLAAAPRVMLLDEPTSALDRETEHRIIKTLFELRDRGHTIIMATHKVELAPYSDRVLWFEAGKIRVGTFEQFHHSLAELVPDESMRNALAFGGPRS